MPLNPYTHRAQLLHRPILAQMMLVFGLLLVLAVIFGTPRLVQTLRTASTHDRQVAQLRSDTTEIGRQIDLCLNHSTCERPDDPALLESLQRQYPHYRLLIAPDESGPSSVPIPDWRVDVHDPKHSIGCTLYQGKEPKCEDEPRG